MLIRSKIERKLGTTVHFPKGVAYRFEPKVKDGPHVCEVDNEEHAERLLAITEGYEPAEVSADDVPVPLEVILPAKKRKKG